MRRFIAKDVPKEDSPELRKGVEVHRRMEEYIKNNGFRWLPPELEAHAKPLLGPTTKAELMLGMTKDMTPEGFFTDPWGRGKLDVAVFNPPMAFIVDWKTGKVREDDKELRQQALLVRANYPEITRISGCYVWLAERKMGTVYDLSNVDRAYRETIARMEQAQAYEDAGDWPKTPNPLCGWCNVIDCQFRKERGL
jgi:hypothetical protein